MVVNVEKLIKMVENGDFFKICQKMVKCWKMLVKTLKQISALIFFYTLDIKNIIFNPKFYQHFLPSLSMSKLSSYSKSEQSHLCEIASKLLVSE